MSGDTLHPGSGFKRRINQADRDCVVIATRGDLYVYEYVMPAGGLYLRIGNTETGKERSISRESLPRWAAEYVSDNG